MWLLFVTGHFLSFLYMWIIHTSYWVILLLLLLLLLGLLSQVSSPCYFSSSNNSYLHRSCFKFQSATLSILYVMFQVHPSILSNVCFALPFIGQTAVVSA